MKRQYPPRMARDDFSPSVKDKLAKRVGTKCSVCGCETSGPHSEPEKSVSIGMAAHITAAAPGGPRYDATLSREERSSIENGIWTCENHGKLVDTDKARYTVQQLRTWKVEAEERQTKRLQNLPDAPSTAERRENSIDALSELQRASNELRVETARKSALEDRKGVDLARQSFVDLCSAWANLASQSPELLEVSSDRTRCFILHGWFTLAFHFALQYANVVGTVRLVVQIWRGHLHLQRGFYVREPEQLEDWEYSFDLNDELTPVWRRGRETRSTDQLVAENLKRLLEHGRTARNEPY
jgi:hypothetical protein